EVRADDLAAALGDERALGRRQPAGPRPDGITRESQRIRESDEGAEREPEDAIDGAQIVFAERADRHRHRRSLKASSTHRPFAATSLVLLLVARIFAAPSPHAAVNEPVVIRPPGVAWSLPATLVIPEASAPVPCIVFFAGSGPTDRDWLSPMLPGKNGRARQLADGLAGKSVGSLRFDKVGSGTNQGPLDVLSLAHYVAEATAAFDFLAARPECSTVFLLGHSEGSLHMTSAAVAQQDSARFGGLISMAGPSRSLLETAIEQIRDAHRKAGDDMPAVE